MNSWNYLQAFLCYWNMQSKEIWDPGENVSVLATSALPQRLSQHKVIFRVDFFFPFCLSV